MAEADVNKESDSESSLELEIGSDGTIRLSFFWSQNTGCLQKKKLTWTRLKINQKRWNQTYDRVWQSRLPSLICPQKCGCCQEMDVLGDRLDLKGRN